MLDASEDGLQFQAVGPVEHGDGQIPLWFTLNPTNRIETLGEVMWTDETRRTGGLRFINLPGETRIHIRQWLEQNGMPLPVRPYATSDVPANRDAATVEQTEDEPVAESFAGPSREVESVAESAHSFEELVSLADEPFTPDLPPEPPALEPRQNFFSIQAPSVRPRETQSPPEAAPSIIRSVPEPEFEPKPSFAVGEERAIDGATVEAHVDATPHVIEAAAPTPAELGQKIFGGAIPPAAEPEPEIPKEAASSNLYAVPDPPAGQIEAKPGTPSLSYEFATPVSAYSGYESEEIVREVSSAAMHRPEDDPRLQNYGPSVVQFPAPPSRAPNLAESTSPYPSRAGISVRTSDYATPWRPAVASRYTQAESKESRLAGMLAQMGVPEDLLRGVEILVVVCLLVVSLGIALLIFHRQVGDGIQWLGLNLSGKAPEAVTKQPAPIEPAASPESSLSPLLQAPPDVKAAPVVVKRKPKPADEASASAPTSSTPSANAAEPALPPLPEDTGEAELANALQYLRGDSGSTETMVGVKWLWASVEKGNTKAAIILADLYAWGRGVPQNCDQARVLLVAAAKRGSTEASQRLVDMEAEGCSTSKSNAH